MNPQNEDNSAGLTAALYSELRAIAHRFLDRERAWHTLQTTALVHEAYIRLSADKRWPGRPQFLAAASQVMREVLIDYARSRLREKRGGDPVRITLEEWSLAVRGPSNLDLLAIDEALRRLEKLDARQARIVEMRFFAGMSLEEIAGFLDVNTRTVTRDWAMARAWLRRELAGEPGGN